MSATGNMAQCCMRVCRLEGSVFCKQMSSYCQSQRQSRLFLTALASLGQSYGGSPRHISLTSRCMDKDIHNLERKHYPTNLEKQMLVWARSYKAKDDIPESVSATKMKRAKDYFRIRVSLSMALVTAIACVYMIYSGRHMRDAGDSLHKRELAVMHHYRKQGIAEEQQKQT